MNCNESTITHAILQIYEDDDYTKARPYNLNYFKIVNKEAKKFQQTDVA